MGLVFTMGMFFIVVTVIFIAITVFFPEWIGITGKKAKAIIAAQQQEELDENAKSTSALSHGSTEGHPQEIKSKDPSSPT